MDRDMVLSKKVEQMRTGIERWVTKKGILTDGERAIIEVRIEKLPLVTTEIRKKKTRRLVDTGKKLEPEDWEKILAIPFPESARAVIDIFHENGNEPIFPHEIKKRL